MQKKKNPAAVRLGSVKSDKKSVSSAANGKGWKRPHLEKVRHFESVFPFKLRNNEWLDKFRMKIDGKWTTYNPDYYCPELNCYVEVATSKPNISEQGPKWRKMIELGHPLKVFWWEGKSITDIIVNPVEYRDLDENLK